MSAEIDLKDVADLLDGVSAYEQFFRLNGFYVECVKTGEGPLEVGERRALLQLVRSSIALIESADLFVQSCRELTLAADGPALERRLDDLLSPERLGITPKKPITGADALQLAEQGARSIRAVLARERELLPRELLQLQAGDRPARGAISDDMSSEEMAAAAMMLASASALAAAAAASAAAAPKVAVVGIALGGAVLEGVAISIAIHALAE